MTVCMDPTFWECAVAKVIDHAVRHRLPDLGGVRLLELMGHHWRSCAADALAEGCWQFQPLIADFSYNQKVQTISSLIDRVIVQLILSTSGWRLQTDLINDCLDDDLMPIPPAFRFRPPDARYMYSHWVSDYGLWKDAQRLFAKRGYSWVVYCDIRDCFYSIPRQSALNVVNRYIGLEEHRNLLNQRFSCPVQHGKGDHLLVSGLPVGEPSSHLIANAYMSQIDQWAVRELGVPFLRYVDDMRFFCASETEARLLLAKIQREIPLRFGLQLNLNKSGIESIPRSVDLSGAVALLDDLKMRTREPLEAQRRYFLEFVGIDAVLDSWNAVRKALASSVICTATIDAQLDFLSSLRPSHGFSRSFAKLMTDILESTVNEFIDPSPQRNRLISTAMIHIRCSDADQAVGILTKYAESEDPQVSEPAFNNIVHCKTDRARDVAEGLLLRSSTEPGSCTVQSRLAIFTKVYGATARLRARYAKASDWQIRTLISSGRGNCGPNSSQLRRALQDELHLVRRNAALDLLERPTWSPALTAAWREALRGETNRDARLAMLIAGACNGSLWDSKVAEPSLMPQSLLEANLCAVFKNREQVDILDNGLLESLSSSDIYPPADDPAACYGGGAI